jgi:hypothetical protein
LEGVLVKSFGSLHVLNIDLEPAYRTALCCHSGCRFFELNSNTRRTSWPCPDMKFDFSSFGSAGSLGIRRYGA